MFNTQTANLLSLSKEETLVLKSLYTKDCSVSEISKNQKVPRTSLYTAITSLLQRGLIHSSNKGKSRILSLKNAHLIEQLNQILGSKEKDSSFTFIYGKDDMLEKLTYIFSQKNKRVYSIQPTASLLHILHKFHASVFVPINEQIKKNKVIVEAIIKEDAFTTYLNEYKHDKAMQRKILESFHGRMNSSTFVSKKYLNCGSEIYFDNKEAYLYNWKSEVGIRIANKDMVDFLHEMFEFTKGYGKKDDLNRVVTEKLQALIELEANS